MARIASGSKAVNSWATTEGTPHLESAAKTVSTLITKLDSVDWKGQRSDDFYLKLDPMKTSLENGMTKLASTLNTDLASAINPLLVKSDMAEVSFELAMGQQGAGISKTLGASEAEAMTEHLTEAAAVATTQGVEVYQSLSEFVSSFKAIPEEGEGGWQMPNRDALTATVDRVVMSEASVSDDGVIDGGYASGLQQLFQRIATFLETEANELETAASGMQAGD